jgi:predicted Rossmann fold flavoprotein
VAADSSQPPEPESVGTRSVARNPKRFGRNIQPQEPIFRPPFDLVEAAIVVKHWAVEFDVIVIGGGAAGLFCARVAGLRGKRALVIEHNERVGKKILISGGGRCNFTNLGATAANYFTSGSPHFMKSALARFTPQDFIALVERHGIAWHEKKLGQLFCDNSSRQIVDLLEAECADSGVEIRVSQKVAAIEHVSRGSSTVEGVASTDKGNIREYVIRCGAETFTAPSLVIATGGLSFPKLGATPFAYSVAGQFGIKIVPTRPGLVPLTFTPTDLSRFADLSGLSIDCLAKGPSEAPPFRENLLFTHRGLTGPAILQVSNYWRPGESIIIDLLPGQNALELFAANRESGRAMKNVLRQALPDRFVQAWCQSYPESRPVAQWPLRELEQLARSLHGWEIKPAGDEGYSKAEVTLGGIDTGELSSKTLECRRAPGLYFIGEAVDVNGWLGGYNFQWAWASGHAAGQAV